MENQFHSKLVHFTERSQHLHSINSIKESIDDHTEFVPNFTQKITKKTLDKLKLRTNRSGKD